MKSKLIKELKEQHKKIILLFNNLTSYMMGEMVARIDVLFSLRKLKAVLTKHLELEDVSLYPKLNQAKNKEARETAKKFSDDMLEISKIVFDFFDRYLRLKVSELETNQKFKKELKEIDSIVTKRIDTEERTLFPLYKSLVE